MNSKSMLSKTGILIILSCSCGGEGGGLALGDLEGSYDITGSVDNHSHLSGEPPPCVLTVRGSSASATCGHESEYGSETLEVEVIVTETVVSGELVFEYEQQGDETCYQSYKEITTITASATKESGSMVEGVFAPLAGTWAGELTAEVDHVVELLPMAPSYCEEELRLSAYSFEADVRGSTAQIDWSHDDDSGTIEVVGSENAISVNETVFPK